MKLKEVSFLLLFVITSSVVGQKNVSKIIKFEEDTVSPKATLQDVSWISGYWRGEAFGGIIEEIWSDPLGDSMMFSFKLVIDNKVKFYEIGGITQKDSTLLLQLKHFDGDFKGWEEKEKTIDFRLVKIEKNIIYFDEFTFEKVSPSEMNVYININNDDETSTITTFNYKKL
ncbi:DUF6265 family protein [Aquimarina pacifica]|uniref:DUF6265 family protein n=1 Tax=Aquimarina pacifica TaxID=1296415 RepID=UPI000471684D|nr:DUF6265 family protein [Aquimarina pacifica]